MRGLLALCGLIVVGACSSSELAPKGPATISMKIIGGDAVTAGVGTAVPLTVKVTDAQGNAIPNQLVNWVVTSNSGALFVAASLADQGGIARNQLTLGTGDNTVELRAIDPDGTPVTYATLHDLGGRIVNWRAIDFDHLHDPDNAFNYTIYPNVPFDMTKHMAFQLVDVATGQDIPNLIVPPETEYYFYNGNVNGGSCGGDITALLCSGSDYGSFMNIFPQGVSESGPLPGYVWDPAFAVVLEVRYRNEMRVSIGQGAAAPPSVLTAAFTYTCSTRHVCKFDASSSTIPLGIGSSGYNWYFGDGYQGTKVTVQHDYPHAGQYTVQLSIYDTKGKNAKVTTVITVQ